jgi:hypothetical protein
MVKEASTCSSEHLQTELEQTKARYLGKSGALTELLGSLGQMPAEERRAGEQHQYRARSARSSPGDAAQQLAQSVLEASGCASPGRHSPAAFAALGVFIPSCEAGSVSRDLRLDRLRRGRRT